MAMASAVMLSPLPPPSPPFPLLLFTALAMAMAMAMLTSPRRNDCPPASHRRNRQDQRPIWTTACWYCPQAPCGWQLLFQLLLPWILLLTLCMPHARASVHNSIFTQVAFLPYEEEGMEIMGFCTEPSLQLKNQYHQEEEDQSNRVLLNGSTDVSLACGSCHVSKFFPLSIQTSWNCVEKGRVCAHGITSSEEASECLCFQACSSTKWNVTTGYAEGMLFIDKMQPWTESSRQELKMKVTQCNNFVNGPTLTKETFGWIESKHIISSSSSSEVCGRNPVPPSSVNPSVDSSFSAVEKHFKVNLCRRVGSEAPKQFKAFGEYLCSSVLFQTCFHLRSSQWTEKISVNDIMTLNLLKDSSCILSYNVSFGESGGEKSELFQMIDFIRSGSQMLMEGENEYETNPEQHLQVQAFLTCSQVVNISDENFEHFKLQENICLGSVKQMGFLDCAKYGLEIYSLVISCPLRGSTGSLHCEGIRQDVGCKPSSFYRSRKLVGKVSLITALLVLAMLTKTMKQDRQLPMDFRLWFSCSYTVFLQSVYSKSDALKADENILNKERILDDQSNGLSILKNQPYKQCFSVILGRIVANIGYIFRRFLDSQDTMLNVRVQIAENCELKSKSVDSSHCDILIDNVMNSLSTPVERIEDIFGTIASDASSNLSAAACMGNLEEDNAFHLDPPSIPDEIVEKSLSIKTYDACDPCDVRVKEKKERRKRRKHRSNIIDLKRESERDSISGSSSPSSPASPATPLPYRGNGPFSQCNPSSNSGKATTFHNSRGQEFRNSFARLRNNEPLSQLDVHAHHVYAPFNKDRIYHLHCLTSKANAKHPLKVPQATDAKVAGSRMVDKGNRNDKMGIFNTSENWATVARRAASKPEVDQIEKMPDPREVVKSNNPSVKKPVLLPSATFPQGGRSTQWRPQLLDGKFPVLEDPTLLSSSLVSTSLVAPDARAPGSRLAKNVNEKQLLGALEKTSNSENALDLRINHRDTKNDVFLYDIWGDHFSEISRGSRGYSNKLDGFMLSCDGSTSNKKPDSFFASPDFMVQITGITESGPPSSSFSIFSCDTIFSQTLPAEDQMCSFAPDEL